MCKFARRMVVVEPTEFADWRERILSDSTKHLHQGFSATARIQSGFNSAAGPEHELPVRQR